LRNVEIDLVAEVLRVPHPGVGYLAVMIVAAKVEENLPAFFDIS
jgi:hypothetical protein